MKKTTLLLLFAALFSAFSIADSGQLKVTLEHPFYLDGEWVEASELEIGDELKTYDGKTVRITNIRKVETEEPVTVYNLEDDFYLHNYIVDLGLVVHNSNIGPEAALLRKTPGKIRSAKDVELTKVAEMLKRNYGRAYHDKIAKGQVPTEQDKALMLIGERAYEKITHKIGNPKTLVIDKCGQPVGTVSVFESDLSKAASNAFSGEFLEIGRLTTDRGSVRITDIGKLFLRMLRTLAKNKQKGVLMTNKKHFKDYQRILGRYLLNANNELEPMINPGLGTPTYKTHVGNLDGEWVSAETFIGIIENPAKARRHIILTAMRFKRI